MTSVVHEPAVLALLGWRPGTDRLEPRRQRGPASTGVDDEVGADYLVVVGDHAGDVGDLRAGELVRW